MAFGLMKDGMMMRKIMLVVALLLFAIAPAYATEGQAITCYGGAIARGWGPATPLPRS